jgi:hypothetical protein
MSPPCSDGGTVYGVGAWVHDRDISIQIQEDAWHPKSP